MNENSISAALCHAYPNEVHLLDDGQCLVLGGQTAARTVTLDIADDSVRIAVSRIMHAEAYDDEGDLSRILRVVGLLLSGRADELYGSTGTGVFGFIGYRIWDPEGAIERLDDGAVVIHTAPL